MHHYFTKQLKNNKWHIVILFVLLVLAVVELYNDKNIKNIEHYIQNDKYILDEAGDIIKIKFKNVISGYDNELGIYVKEYNVIVFGEDKELYLTIVVFDKKIQIKKIKSL